MGRDAKDPSRMPRRRMPLPGSAASRLDSAGSPRRPPSSEPQLPGTSCPEPYSQGARTSRRHKPHAFTGPGIAMLSSGSGPKNTVLTGPRVRDLTATARARRASRTGRRADLQRAHAAKSASRTARIVVRRSASRGIVSSRVTHDDRSRSGDTRRCADHVPKVGPGHDAIRSRVSRQILSRVAWSTTPRKGVHCRKAQAPRCTAHRRMVDRLQSARAAGGPRISQAARNLGARVEE